MAKPKKAGWRPIYSKNRKAIGSNPNLIRPGEKLKMPDGSTHVVKKGENLTRIANGSKKAKKAAPPKITKGAGKPGAGFRPPTGGPVHGVPPPGGKPVDPGFGIVGRGRGKPPRTGFKPPTGQRPGRAAGVPRPLPTPMPGVRRARPSGAAGGLLKPKPSRPGKPSRGDIPGLRPTPSRPGKPSRGSLPVTRIPPGERPRPVGPRPRVSPNPSPPIAKRRPGASELPILGTSRSAVRPKRGATGPSNYGDFIKQEAKLRPSARKRLPMPPKR